MKYRSCLGIVGFYSEVSTWSRYASRICFTKHAIIRLSKYWRVLNIVLKRFSESVQTVWSWFLDRVPMHSSWDIRHTQFGKGRFFSTPSLETKSCILSPSLIHGTTGVLVLVLSIRFFYWQSWFLDQCTKNLCLGPAGRTKVWQIPVSFTRLIWSQILVFFSVLALVSPGLQKGRYRGTSST